MEARETAELLLQLARQLHAEGYQGELSPAQWMALRFFSRANSFSRTPSAFAEFQATTRGTASQVIKGLQEAGYLVRKRSKEDARSVILQITAKGRRLLERDPFETVVRAMETLDDKERAALHDSLRQILLTLLAGGVSRSFGVCKNCLHLADVPCSDSSEPMGRKCLQFELPVSPEQAGLLCVHFQPAHKH